MLKNKVEKIFMGKEIKPGQPIRYVFWEEIVSKIAVLSKIIPFNKNIYGLPRNGTILAGLLAHQREDLCLSMSYTKKTIIIDDIHDSGETLREFPDNITATLFWRCKENSKPTYWAESIRDEWLIFPWEKEFLLKPI